MSYFKSDNAVRGIFGEKAYRKLVQLLDPCCGSGSLQPYDVYTALITQSGVDAPVPVVLQNTLNLNVTYERVDAGLYVLTFDKNIFETPNEYVTVSGNAYFKGTDVALIGAVPIFFNALAIACAINGVASDDVIGPYSGYIPCVLEIRKYK